MLQRHDVAALYPNVSVMRRCGEEEVVKIEFNNNPNRIIVAEFSTLLPPTWNDDRTVKSQFINVVDVLGEQRDPNVATEHPHADPIEQEWDFVSEWSELCLVSTPDGLFLTSEAEVRVPVKIID